MKKQIILFLFIMTAVVVKAYDAKIDGIYYNFDSDSNNATVTYQYSGAYHDDANKNAYSGDVVIPSEVIYNNKTYAVTTIGTRAFYYCTGLTSVTIPNSIKTIGSFSFEGCSGLLSLTVGTGITSIGQNAFYNTNLKKTIWLTNTPPSGYNNANGAINYVANEQYSNLNNKIVYPFISSLFDVDGIYYVPVSPSERTCDAIDCKYDETVANTNINSTVSYKGIAMNVQKIQPYLFYNNKFVENLTCNNNGDIGYNAFTECDNLKNVACNNTGKIGDNAFESCSNLSSLSLGGKVSFIGKNTFKNCSSLTSVIIPNSVTRLDNYSFENCI